MHFVAATPAGYEPDAAVTEKAKADAKLTGGSITLVHDVYEAAKDADILYTDVWASMRVATKDGWEENEAIAQSIAEGNQELGDSGRILVRASGTEPLIRVMAEGPDQQQLDVICNRIAAVVKKEQG